MGLKNYQKIDGRIFGKEYVFIDTEDGLSEEIFIQKGIKVKMLREYRKQSKHYKYVICAIRTKDEPAFLDALQIIASEAEKRGIPYSDYCDEMQRILNGQMNVSEGEN